MSVSSRTTAQHIQVATDAAIFTVRDGALNVLLIQMKKKPFTGMWALPGGLIGDRETTAQAAERILRAETGVSDVYLEQLMTFDETDRDPFGRVVSVAWYALVPDPGTRLRTSDAYMDVAWRPVKEAKGLAYDHDEVLAAAVRRVRAKLGYSNIAWSLLPKQFTLTGLQNVYEAILGKAVDKRNFRKKILASGLVRLTGRIRSAGAHRPAALYAFTTRKPVIANIIA